MKRVHLCCSPKLVAKDQVFRLILAIILSCLTFSTASAQGDGLVRRIDPQVGQQGTTVDVRFTGIHIDQPKDVLFYRPGIKVLGFKWLEDKIDRRSGKTSPAEEGTELMVRLEISGDCPVGEHPLRLRTKGQLSETVSFFVTRLPVVKEEDPYGTTNDELDGAQQIPLGCSVWGRMAAGKAQDLDVYRIAATNGQRIAIEMVADRLGTYHYGGMNDPAVSVHNESGRMIARNDDNSLFVTDPMLTFVAPKDGNYFVTVRQQMDYEATERDYIMHIGQWPRPLTVYPLGGQAGKTLMFHVLGDAAGTFQETVRLPSIEQASMRDFSITGDVGKQARLAQDGGYFEYWAKDAGRAAAPSPNRLRVVDFPNVLESEPNDEPESADVNDDPKATEAPALPIALNGMIETEDDVDHFRFKAKQGDRWFLRTFASALGSELDPRVWITRVDNGQRVRLSGAASGGGGNQRLLDDDATWEGLERIAHSYRHQTQDRLDPHLYFEVPEDGEYVLAVTDTRAHFGPEHVYRVEFHRWRDKIFTYLPPYPSQTRDLRDRFEVPIGGFASRTVSLQKGLGSRFAGALKVEAIGLPRGVRMIAPTLYPGQTDFLVLFEGHAQAPHGQALIDLIVKPADGTESPFLSTLKQTTVNTQRRGDFAMHFIFTEQAAMAVVDPTPFTLELVQPGVPLAVNGELSIKVRCHRRPGFDGPVYCEMDWLPPGVTKQVPLTLEPGETEAEYRLNATSNARLGQYKLAISGREDAGGDIRSGAGVHFISSNFIDLKIADPYVSIEIARASIERTKQAKIRCKLTHKRKLPAAAVATLKRLPTGVRVVEPLPEIKSGDKEVTFTISAAEDSLLGQYKDIYCELTIIEDGQEIRQQTGAGVLRIDARRGGE